MTPEPAPASALPASSEAAVPAQPQPVGETTLPPTVHRPGAIDACFVLLVGGLAFLLASTPSRNSDLWLHLASGRSQAEGAAAFGVDPFASTTGGVLWVNSTWMADAGLFSLYARFGGQVLVVAKAALVALLACLLFCFRRRGERTGLLALGSAVAVVATGPWLLLQPVLLSLLGVLLTLYLLERPNLVEPSRLASARKARWLLVPLFALWANLDGWFVLGPALVGLYALGEGLRRLLDRASVPAGEWPALALLTLVATAACLVNPFHYHAFAVPTPLGLTPAEQAWMGDPAGAGLVVNAFGRRFVTSVVAASPGGWAYYALLVGGAASFLLAGGPTAGRWLAWVALAALSIYQARAIPFFAVAAGPVLVLNVQLWLRDRPLSPPWQRLQPALRGLGILVGLGLCLVAWPGWLQPAPYQPRRWAVEPDESLVRMAGQLKALRAEKKLPQDHFALTFSPEVAHYLAWFCPAEKGFLDTRWPLFNGVASDYVRMRKAILDGESGGAEFGSLLDKYRLDRVVLSDADWGRASLAYQRLLADDKHWVLLGVEGSASLFGRRVGQGPTWNGFDAKQAAYHPSEEKQAPPGAPAVPQQPGPFDPFYQVRKERSPDRAEAALHLIAFDQAAQRMRTEVGLQWLGTLTAALVGSASGGGTGFPATASNLAVRLNLFPVAPGSQTAGLGEPLTSAFATSRDRGPPELLLLAIRAARRAIADDPEDGGAWLLLGEAYFRMAGQTREQSRVSDLPLLGGLRQVQMLTALEQAVLLRPDLDQAHALLAQLYYGSGQLDRTLEHLRARLRISQKQAAGAGGASPVASERQASLQLDVNRMEEMVKRARDIYQGNVGDKTDPSGVYSRAQLASRYGLSKMALDMLLESHPAIFGKAGAKMQLDLMLRAGRAFEVRSWLEPEHEQTLGFSTYHWLIAQADAGCGDYAGADANLDQVTEEMRGVRVSAEQLLPVRAVVALRAAEAVLARSNSQFSIPGMASSLYFQNRALHPLGEVAVLLRKEADIRVLRALLALEAGAVKDARRDLRAALDIWGSDSRASSGAGLDFSARPLALEVLRLLDAASRQE